MVRRKGDPGFPRDSGPRERILRHEGEGNGGLDSEIATSVAGCWEGLDHLAGGAMHAARPGSRSFAALMWAGLLSARARDTLGLADARFVPRESGCSQDQATPASMAAQAAALASRLSDANRAVPPGPARDAIGAAASDAGDVGRIIAGCAAAGG